jgi:hypothetical protein
MKKLTLFFFFLMFLAVTAFAGDKAPVPQKLITAKKAFVVNDGTPSKVFDKFYAEIKKWSRFTLVESKDQADVVIMLTAKNDSNSPSVVPVITGGSDRSAGGGVIVGSNQPTYHMRITDAKDSTPLWADSSADVVWAPNSPRKMISSLRKRIEEQEGKPEAKK